MKNKSTMITHVPGMAPIELVAWYERFETYYPYCEMATKKWVVQNVKEDWHIMDCGANIGYYSILFSRLTHGRIWAFEPTDTIKMLEENLAFNKVDNVRTLPVALGKKTGVYEDSIYRIWGDSPELREYDFTTIDAFIREYDISRMDCIKIDVDSFDFEVLQGSCETMERFDPVIIVELNHALSKRNQSNLQALQWMRENGYTEVLCLDHENFVFQKSREFNQMKFIKIYF